jgi:hypothetical protein
MFCGIQAHRSSMSGLRLRISSTPTGLEAIAKRSYHDRLSSCASV